MMTINQNAQSYKCVWIKILQSRKTEKSDSQIDAGVSVEREDSNDKLKRCREYSI